MGIDDLIVLGVGVVLAVAATPTMLTVIDRVPRREAASLTLASPAPPSTAEAPAWHRGLVQVGAPVLFAAASVRWGASWVVVPFWLLFGVLLVVSVIDLEHHRIPDRIVFPTLAVSVPLIVVVSAAIGAPRAVWGALIGAAAYFVFLLVPHLVYPKGLGFGDVKLGLLLGLYLGWIYLDRAQGISLVLMSLVIGSLLGAATGIVLALARGRRAEFPFGPALATGCVVAVLWSDQLVA